MVALVLPAVLGMAEPLPAIKSRELIPCSALLACVALALIINLSLSQPVSFLTFILLVLFPPH